MNYAGWQCEDVNITDMIFRHVKKSPNSIALITPRMETYTYRQLSDSTHRLFCNLLKAGVQEKSRIAFVLPSNAETAIVFLAVAQIATCIPLNPAYSTREFKLYLSTMNATAVIVRDGFPQAAVTAARELRIQIISLMTARQNGVMELTSNVQRVGKSKAQAMITKFSDTALLLHTSGTTAQPKIVPITHEMLACSVQNTAKAFNLTKNDRCLSVAPMFHTHGLVVAVLASLFAGGSVICLPKFDEDQFFHSLSTLAPTWYTAVPAIHQRVLDHTQKLPDFKTCSLRFIRSAAGPLPIRLGNELEEKFAVPVINTYGMTEASSQIASEPLSPMNRKKGSVGTSNGCKLAIMDIHGMMLDAKIIGEVVIRGQNVLKEYENNPIINEQSFRGGWFRTGDQGYVDEDGYLFITGRLKEIINRGGQKILPNEIDDILAEHPAIAEAAAFPIPHATLGYDLGVAIVLRQGFLVSASEVRQFVSQHLAQFKVPSRVSFVAQIPKGPTGKIRRSMLAEKVLTDPSTHREKPVTKPVNSIEARLVSIWKGLLHAEEISILDDFFQVGGDSLTATILLAEIEGLWNCSISYATMRENPILKDLAQTIKQHDAEKALIAIQAGGKMLPIYCVHPIDGDIGAYLKLVNHLEKTQPVFGLRATGLGYSDGDSSTMEVLARQYVFEILEQRPSGPYILVGYSFGGVIAFEMAQQLINAKKEVVLLLIDTRAPKMYQEYSKIDKFIHKTKKSFSKFSSSPLEYLAGKLEKLFAQPKEQTDIAHIRRVANYLEPIRDCYNPLRYNGKIILFRAADRVGERYYFEETLGWKYLTERPIDIYVIPGNHDSIMHEPNVGHCGKIITKYLSELQQ
ncbi:MAG: non-ribosomal peptide synthetase [Negativicutes bacterium]|nr:non-ribosomal peptide synthetase [Negativicutes bacterium]